MLKATFIGNGEKGVSRNYKVTGPSTEVAEFKAWNLSQIGKDGSLILRKFPDVLTVPSNNYNELGEITGPKPLYITGTVVRRQLLAGERMGQITYEFIPSAYESAIKAIAGEEGMDTAVQMVNLGIINKAELDATSFTISAEAPSLASVAPIQPMTLSNTSDLSMPTENATEPQESEPKSENQSTNTSNKKG